MLVAVAGPVRADSAFASLPEPNAQEQGKPDTAKSAETNEEARALEIDALEKSLTDVKAQFVIYQDCCKRKCRKTAERERKRLERDKLAKLADRASAQIAHLRSYEESLYPQSFSDEDATRVENDFAALKRLDGDGGVLYDQIMTKSFQLDEPNKPFSSLTEIDEFKQHKRSFVRGVDLPQLMGHPWQ